MKISDYDSCDAINDVAVIREAIENDLLGATDREAAYAKVYDLISATFSNQALIEYLLDTELEVLEDVARADAMWEAQRPTEEAAESELARKLEEGQA